MICESIYLYMYFSFLKLSFFQTLRRLVCSDIISRGIDIQGVENVINYDIPLDMPKYVHRVGRTARAGLEGNAYTLVEEQEAKYFKNYLKHSKHFERIKKYRVNKKQVEPMLDVYDVS